MPEQVVAFEEALEIVRHHALGRRGSAGTERLKLLDARGRVLAQPVTADRDQPAFDRVTRDGYAVRAVELAGGSGVGGPVVRGHVRAGFRWEGTLPEGTAVQIMTGAPLPEGADAVAMVEHVTLADGRLRLQPGRTLAAGENFVPRGSEARAGEALLAPGTRLGAAGIALAASCGCAELNVEPRPRVAIVATGDELVELAGMPGPEQIRNSNGYGLAALCVSAGAAPSRLAIARDTREDIRERIAQGRGYDLLLLSGGVSMGEYDLVEEVLRELGAEFFFTGVRMQPGKPVVFGRLPAQQRTPSDRAQPECLFFGLPGNPISTQVTFQCFAAPLLRVMAGEPWSGPRWALATLSGPAEGRPGLVRLLPGRMEGTEARVLPWQGSGDMAANARANCFLELTESRAAGDLVRVLLGGDA